jgi:hypothetical protein
VIHIEKSFQYENTEIKKVCDEAEDKLITTLYKKVVKKD